MSLQQKSLLICPPDYFDVIYEINPWMSINNRPESGKPQEQWQVYRQILEQVGFKLEQLVPMPGVPDLVFTANHALVYGQKVVLAEMRFPERQLEKKYYQAWFESNRYDTFLPSSGYFEGEGDAFIIDQVLYYGYGFRSDPSVAEEIKDYLGLKKIVYVQLIDPYFYHLDTCFAPLGEGRVLVYPEAIAEESQKEITKHLLPIAVSRQEAEQFVCNAVVYGKKIVMAANCPIISKTLEQLGYEIYPVNLTEFLRAGGSAKCLCLYL